MTEKTRNKKGRIGGCITWNPPEGIQNPTITEMQRGYIGRTDRDRESRSRVLMWPGRQTQTFLASALPGSCERSKASSSISPPGETGMSAGFLYFMPRSSLSSSVGIKRRGDEFGGV